MSTNKEKIDQLTIALKNKDIGAAEELAQLGDDGVSVLVHELEDTTADKEVRVIAAQLLGKHKDNTEYLEPALTFLLQEWKDPNSTKRSCAASALGEVILSSPPSESENKMKKIITEQQWNLEELKNADSEFPVDASIDWWCRLVGCNDQTEL